MTSVSREQPEHPDHWVHRELLETKDNKVSQDNRDLRVRLDHREDQEHEDKPEQPDLQVQLGQRVPRVRLEPQD